jgi:hypothetical protein
MGFEDGVRHLCPQNSRERILGTQVPDTEFNPSLFLRDDPFSGCSALARKERRYRTIRETTCGRQAR